MENYKVKWYVADKRLIKFQDVNETYTVAEDINVDGVAPTVDVKVEIKDSIVISLTIETKKEEKVMAEDTKKAMKDQKETQKEVVEEKPAVNKEEAPAKEEKEIKPVIWTISAIAFEKGVVKFEEQPPAMTWYPITPKAKKAFEGLRKGDKIQIWIDTVDAESKGGEAYTKDGIVDAKVIAGKKEEPKQTEEKKDETKKETKETDKSAEEGTKEAYSISTSDSIERQVALKEAGAIIRSLIEKGTENVNSDVKINKLLSSFTKGSLEALRNA